MDRFASSTMTETHPRWEEFCDRLNMALRGAAPREDMWAFVRGCNSRSHPTPYATARAILAQMNMDVEASLRYYGDRGGNCDCTILLNVEETEEDGNC